MKVSIGYADSRGTADQRQDYHPRSISRVSEGSLSVTALNPIHSGSNKSLYLRKEAVFDCKGRPA